jgi:hypothetical protein
MRFQRWLPYFCKPGMCVFSHSARGLADFLFDADDSSAPASGSIAASGWFWRHREECLEQRAAWRMSRAETKRNLMKSYRSILALAAAAGVVVLSAAGAHAQTLKYISTEPATATPASQPTGEATQVEAALTQFDSALASHDVTQMRAAGLRSTAAKGWQKFFKSNPEAKVTDDCPVWALTISGASASWSCTETATIISEGRPRQFAQVIRFTFAKLNGEWLIADRR